MRTSDLEVYLGILAIFLMATAPMWMNWLFLTFKWGVYAN